MSYKLICLDLDGTLLTSQHTISEANLAVLRALEDQGIRIAIVSGRSGYDAKHHARTISNKTFYIGSNGAIVGNVATGEIIAETNISKGNLRKIVSYARETRIKPIVFTKNETIIHGPRDYFMHLYLNRKHKTKMNAYLRFVPSHRKMKCLIAHEDTGIQKVVFFITNKYKADQIEKELKAQDDFEVARTSLICFEVTEKGMNKSDGIRRLIEHLNIKKEEVMAFGDSENDYAMLSYVGYGVAMGNAPNRIKAVADKITDTNDQDGVANELKNIFSDISYSS
ncbi:MAG: hypothetical protein CVU95_13690 [Firmicutes bacterium HGW-Firmicutes-2]|jgi:hypothetical protein|nr:MAG: hypothetical protein CVU95_13690 [Firmicutes bacterium HGW-Firmicutes-2]